MTRRPGLALFCVSALCAPGLYIIGMQEHVLAWLGLFVLMVVAILLMAAADASSSDK